MASVSLLEKKQHVFLSHAPRGLISALYLVQQCHCKQQLSSTALKAGGSSAAAEQRMKQEGRGIGCWVTAQAQHSLHVVLQILPLLSDLGFLTRTDKTSLGRLSTAEQDVSASPALAEVLHLCGDATRDEGRGSHSCLLLGESGQSSAALFTIHSNRSRDAKCACLNLIETVLS